MSQCGACGLGRFGSTLVEALQADGIPPSRCAFIHSGGCASEIARGIGAAEHRVPLGSALPFALGLARSRPDTLAIALLGDGEAAGVGGSHLVHAARRADPLRAIVVNNEIVSATGGFPSPTTPRGSRTPATPEGTAERGIDLCELVRVAGGSWIGREVIGASGSLETLLREFLLAEPFAFLEVRAFCYPLLASTYASPEAMLEALERRAIRGDVDDPAAQGAGVSQTGSGADSERFVVGRLWPPRGREPWVPR